MILPRDVISFAISPVSRKLYYQFLLVNVVILSVDVYRRNRNVVVHKYSSPFVFSMFYSNL